MAERNLEIVMQAKDQVSKVTEKITGSLTKVGPGAKKAFDMAKTAAKASVRAIKAVLAPITKLLSLFGLLSGAGFASLIKSAADATDQVGKFSKRLGVSTEFLSEMKFVAGQSGVKIEALNVGMQRATRRFAEFAKTGAGPAADAIKALGIEDAVRQGKTMEELLPQMADGFANMADQSEAVRLAFGLFDSEGVSFVQFLQEGSAGIEKMREEAKRLGLSIDGDAAKAAENFNNKLGVLTGALQGLKLKLGLEFFDDLAATMTRIGGWIAEHRDDIVSFVSQVAKAAKTVVEGIIGAFTNDEIRNQLFQSLGRVFELGFKRVGELAGLAFTNAIISAINAGLGSKGFAGGVADFMEFFGLGDAAEGLRIHARLGNTPRLPYATNDNPTNFFLGSAEEIEKLRAVIDDVWGSKIPDAIGETKNALESSGQNGSGKKKPIEEGGFFAAFVDGFKSQADEMASFFRDAAQIAARFASEMQSNLSSKFFDLAKRQFKDFGTFVRDFFRDLVDSILKIISDALASQVVSGFAKLLGSFLGGGATQGITFGLGGGGGGGGVPGSIPHLDSLPGGGSFDLGPGGTSSSYSSAGGSSSGTTVVFNVNAIDGASVAGFLSRNANGIAAAVAGAASGNNSIRNDLRGAIA